jgi:hypothetical protein
MRTNKAAGFEYTLEETNCIDLLHRRHFKGPQSQQPPYMRKNHASRVDEITYRRGL